MQRNQNIISMTAVQLNTMNTELWQSIGAIADSEPLMTQLAKYLKKLVAKKEDPTLVSKEEFFRRVDEAKAQYDRGEGHMMLPGEDLTAYLRRRGYDI